MLPPSVFLTFELYSIRRALRPTAIGSGAALGLV